MLDIGWTELILIAIVAVVVIGPRDLPRVMRTIGQWSTKVKGMAREFQGQFTDAMRDAELDTIKRDVESIAKMDPIRDVNAEVTRTGSDIRKGLAKPAPVAKPAKPAAPAAKTADAEPVKPPEKEAAAAATAVAEAAPAPAAKTPATAAGDAKP